MPRDPTSYQPAFENVVDGKLAFLRAVRGPEDASYRLLSNRVALLKGQTPPFTFIRCRDNACGVWVYDAPPSSQGTAFVLDGIGLITCNHVVENACTGELFQPSAPTMKRGIKVIFSDKDRDLALLDADIYPAKSLKLSDPREVQKGEQLHLVGFPAFAPGGEVSHVSAKVTERRTVSARQAYLLDETVVPGQSGSPALDASGYVVGVAQRGAVTNDKGEREGLDSAIGLPVLIDFLNEARKAGAI